MAKWVFKLRFLLVILLIAIGCGANLNGSSIALLNQAIGASSDGLLYGTPRGNRSDEWAVFTPLIATQEKSTEPFSWFNDVLRGTDTDVFTVYALPVKNIFGMVFRPFLNGFIFLGFERGLAFFWCARFLCLFIVYFEFFRLLFTDDDRVLSVIGALMVTLSPMVMWWFAINGLVEMLIFLALSLIALDRYLRTTMLRQRLLCLFLIYLSAGGFVLTFYPAFMIPLMYALVPLGVWVFGKNIKSATIKAADILMIIAMIVALGASLGYCFYTSRDSIDAVLHTAYPGVRMYTGGRAWNWFFWVWADVFYPFKEEGLIVTIPEMARVFDMAPLGMLLTLYLMIKKKKADILGLVLTAINVFIFCYISFGVPEIVAKISFFAISHPVRMMMAFGLINIILLIRGLYNAKDEISYKVIVPSALLYALFIVYFERKFYASYYSKKMVLIVAGLVVASTLIMLFYHRIRYIALLYMLILMVCYGGFVNPIQKGTGSLMADELSVEISQLTEKDPKALWITDDIFFPITNYVAMQGAKVINTTNTYPNMDFWEKLDVMGEYRDIYNRYAHIVVSVTPENYVDKEFIKLMQTDLINLQISPKQVSDLGIGYVISTKNLAEIGEESGYFKEVKKVREYRIYKVDR